VLPALAAACALAFGASAHAQEESPYYIGVQQTFTHDSDILRQSGEGSDTISSTGVLGGLNLHLGRQRVYADATANSNRFDRFDQFNNTSYSLSAGLDWETVEHLSGNLRYITSENLIDYGAFDVPTTVKDVQKLQQWIANARYGITSTFAVDGGVQHRSVDFSAAQDPRDYKENVARVGLNWGTSGLLVFRLGLRATKSDYPSAVISPFVPGQPDAIPPIPSIPAVYGEDKINRKDIDLSATWTPSGLSTLTGRLSSTRQTHSQPGIPKLSGLTGALGWIYKPTGKLTFNTSLSRDTGSETLFANLPQGIIPVRGDNDRFGTALGVKVDYALSAKVLLNASVNHRNTGSTTVRGTGDSSTDRVALGASYQPTRSVSLSCNINRESRDNAYGVNVASCSAQFVLR
jgi:hypothetical protein